MLNKQQAPGPNFIDVNAGARIGHEKADMEGLSRLHESANLIDNLLHQILWRSGICLR